MTDDPSLRDLRGADEGDVTRSLRFGQRMAERVPPWLGSIRVRLTLLYSLLLFGLAAVVVGGIYAGFARTLNDQPISRLERQYTIVGVDDGLVMTSQEVSRIDPLAAFEREVNTRALDKLRQYSFAALVLLFIGSLAVGWFVADMVLRPIGRITGVARDIQATGLKRRINLRGPNDELRQLADTFDDMIGRLDESFEGQRHFIQEASHELRNPLAVIRTNVDVVIDDPAADIADHRQVHNVVLNAAERMSVLVDDLLLSARYESPELRREVVNLDELARAAAAEFAAAAGETGVAIVHRNESHGGTGGTGDTGGTAAGTGPVEVSADAQALRRAVANLVVNAMRHSSDGDTISLAAGSEGSWRWLAVEDQGVGIAAGDQERIFGRFWRGDGPSTGRDRRTGLGLTIVRQIAESHSGSVHLASKVGEGSVFTLWLPTAETAAGSAPPSTVHSSLHSW